MKIIICGDTSPVYLKELIEKKDIKTLFNDVPDVLRSADRVIANIECALTDSKKAIDKLGPNLKAPMQCVEIFREIGITDCAISNNHIFDYGIEGVEDTLKAFETSGLNVTGFGKNREDARKNLVIKSSRKSTAIIAVCEHEYSYALENRMGAREFDLYDTMEDIKKAKKENDYVIVLYHGGKEQSVYPSPRLRKLCQSMVSHGADVVLCQHSHCVGCYEEYKEGHILYGQGNFHFIKPGNDHPHWQNGLIVELEIDEKIDISFVPVVVQGNGIALAKDNDYHEIMKRLNSQSENLHNGKWIDGWHQFCTDNKDWYLSVIEKAYTKEASEKGKELFNHFLRCEAHHDVWDELCRLSWETREEI